MLGQPPEHEEGAASIVAGECLQKLVDAPGDATRMHQPLVSRDDRLERPHLKVFFYIDGEEMCDVALRHLHEKLEDRLPEQRLRFALQMPVG